MSNTGEAWDGTTVTSGRRRSLSQAMAAPAFASVLDDVGTVRTSRASGRRAAGPPATSGPGGVGPRPIGNGGSSRNGAAAATAGRDGSDAYPTRRSRRLRQAMAAHDERPTNLDAVADSAQHHWSLDSDSSRTAPEVNVNDIIPPTAHVSIADLLGRADNGTTAAAPSPPSPGASPQTPLVVDLTSAQSFPTSLGIDIRAAESAGSPSAPAAQRPQPLPDAYAPDQPQWQDGPLELPVEQLAAEQLPQLPGSVQQGGGYVDDAQVNVGEPSFDSIIVDQPHAHLGRSELGSEPMVPHRQSVDLFGQTEVPFARMQPEPVSEPTFGNLGWPVNPPPLPKEQQPFSFEVAPADPAAGWQAGPPPLPQLPQALARPQSPMEQAPRVEQREPAPSAQPTIAAMPLTAQLPAAAAASAPERTGSDPRTNAIALAALAGSASATGTIRRIREEQPVAFTADPAEAPNHPAFEPPRQRRSRNRGAAQREDEPELEVSRGSRALADSAATTGRAGRNLPAAIAVGLGLIGLLLASVTWRKEVYVVLACAAVALAVWEIITAMVEIDIEIPAIPAIVGSVGIVVSAYVAGEAGLLVSFTMTVFAALLWRIIDGVEGALRDVSAAIFVISYIPLLGSFTLLMLGEKDGAMRLLVFFGVGVASDIGGYIAGVMLGRHMMAPQISPKKSWEGFAGSVALCIIVGALGVNLLLHAPIWIGVALGAAAAVVATLGDLAESMLKRDIGIKDMSNFLPGHGGLMDRLDSLLLVAPVAYVLLSFLVPA